MRTAQEIFAASKGDKGVPGSLVNSKSFSRTHSNKNYQVGGNRLTFSLHPQDTHAKDFSKHPVHADRPTQYRMGVTGFRGSTGDKVPFNNQPVREVAGSVPAGVFHRAQAGANSLRNQHQSRATARDITGVDTTSRRGGSSVLHFAKPVAGTAHTFAMPGSEGGRGATQLIRVQSVHHIGFHKVIVSKTIKPTSNRKQGAI